VSHVNRAGDTTAFGDRTSRGAFAFAMLAVLAILALTLTYPFNNDNALYAYMADLLLKGGLPYLGSWDQNFPGILLVHAPQILILGRSQLAFHIWDVLLQLVSAIYVYRIAERLGGKRSATLAAILSALYYVQQGLWMSGERDTYVTLLLLVAIWQSIKRDTPIVRAGIWIGLMCGLVILFRPTYALYAIVFSIWFYFVRERTRGREAWAPTLFFFSAVLFPTAIILIVYAMSGGLHELWMATLEFNFKVYGGHGDAFSFWDPIRFYAVSIPAFLIGVLFLWQSRERRTLLLLLGLFLASFISLVVLYRHSVYHYHPMMVLFLLLSAIGWGAIVRRISATSSNQSFKLARVLPITLLSLVVLFFTFQTFRGNTIQLVLRDLVSGKIHTMDQMYAYYEGSPAFGEPAQAQVGDYLLAHTVPGEAVQMFGPYSYPQYRAGLGTTSRFQTLHAIMMRGAGDTLQPFQKLWRKQYLSSLIEAPPKYFIVCDAPEAFRQYYGGRLGHEILRDDFTDLQAWLSNDYMRDTVFGAFTLYRRSELR
jgi:hypothetical protein